MWLFLETTNPNAFTVGLLGGKTPKTWRVLGRSHEVLAHIMKHRALSNIEGICVVSGPGSFTSTRTGVLVANVLSRQLKLPLVGVTLEEAGDLVALLKRLGQPQGVARTTYVAPVYSSEPNITIKTC